MNPTLLHTYRIQNTEGIVGVKTKSEFFQILDGHITFLIFPITYK